MNRLKNFILNTIASVKARGLRAGVKAQIQLLYVEIIVFLARQLPNINPQTNLAYEKFLEGIKGKEGLTILEIGSRNRSGNTYRSFVPPKTTYVGFDIIAGENVDVIGDVHNLSAYFPDQKFDMVYSVAVFEHLAMPWKAILEINHVMKEGGYLYIATHPCWPPHELPWDFWRYQKSSFAALLNIKTGFKLLEATETGSARIVPTSRDRSQSLLARENTYLFTGAYAQKISAPDPNLNWNVKISDITDTLYPK